MMPPRVGAWRRRDVEGAVPYESAAAGGCERRHRGLRGVRHPHINADTAYTIV